MIDIPETVDDTLDVISKLYTLHDLEEIKLSAKDLTFLEALQSNALAITPETKKQLEKIWGRYTGE